MPAHNTHTSARTYMSYSTVDDDEYILVSILTDDAFARKEAPYNKTPKKTTEKANEIVDSGMNALVTPRNYILKHEFRQREKIVIIIFCWVIVVDFF